jgi:hypothetical protein
MLVGLSGWFAAHHAGAACFDNDLAPLIDAAMFKHNDAPLLPRFRFSHFDYLSLGRDCIAGFPGRGRSRGSALKPRRDAQQKDARG